MKQLDARGLSCPEPVIMIRKAMQSADKEYEIITLVADGLSNKEIASQLYLSEGTVRNYLSTIVEKLGLRYRTQLAIFYYQHK